jgi:hypothetical protein
MEAAVSIEVPAGPRLEGKLSVPEGSKAGLVLCHPHPLFPHGEALRSWLEGCGRS